MSIRVSSYSVTVGVPQSLEVAQGEDREYRLTFSDGGTVIDFTGATAILLTVKTKAGAALFSRSYTGFVGGLASSGAVRFQVLQADTASAGVGSYDCDVTWTDASGYKTQILVVSNFDIVEGVSSSSDTVTTPPAIPVVYGLSWWPSGVPGFWSSISGGYHINDAVQAYDGSIGNTAISTFRAIASGVTFYPIGPTLWVNSGWAYVGQHGGAGFTGATGPQGPTGPTGAQGGTGPASNDAFLATVATSFATGIGLKVVGASLYGPLHASGGVSDSAQYMVGLAQWSSAGSGSAVMIVGPKPVWVRSDGASSMANGFPVVPSPSMAGHFRQGLVSDSNIIGIVFGSGLGATAGGLINVL